MFIQEFFRQIRQEGGSHTGAMEPVRLHLEETLGYFISKVLMGHLIRKAKTYHYIKTDMMGSVRHEALGIVFPARKSKTTRYILLVPLEAEEAIIEKLASELNEYDCYTGPFVDDDIIRSLVETASVHGEAIVAKGVPIPLVKYFLSPQRAVQLMKRYELKKVTPASTNESWPVLRQAIDRYHADLMACIHDAEIIGHFSLIKLNGRITAGSAQGNDRIVLYGKDQQYVFIIGKVMIRTHQIQFIIGSRITEPFGKELLPKTGTLCVLKTLSNEEIKAFILTRNEIQRKLNRLKIHYEF